MNINYSKPVVNDDGTILIEQVTVFEAQEMPNGIRTRELKIIQELYPNLGLLKETISRAKANYEDVEKQAHKSVIQLDQEKKALVQLEEMVKNLE